MRGHAPGVGNIYAEMGPQEWYVYDGLECLDNGPYTVEDGGPVAVVPKIDSISPDRALIGQPVDVTISGSGFGNSPTVTAGTGISVVINSASSTVIHARFNIATNAPGGNHLVFVTTSTGQQSNGSNFFVQVPINFIPINLADEAVVRHVRALVVVLHKSGQS